MSKCVPSMPCFQNTTNPEIPCNSQLVVTTNNCGCPAIDVNSTNVIYSGTNLTNTLVNNLDNLTLILSKIDSTFNKYVPLTRILTINGISYDLSQDRSWDLTGVVTTVTASSPLSSTGGATPNITISQATTTTNGYLSSVDWNTFNNKQSTLTFTNGLTNTIGTVTLGGDLSSDITFTSSGLSIYTLGTVVSPIQQLVVNTYRSPFNQYIATLNVYGGAGQFATTSSITGDQFAVGTDTSGAYVSGNNVLFKLNNGAAIFSDFNTSKKGIQYAATGYVTQLHSLTDKEYSDSHLKGLTFTNSPSLNQVPQYNGTNITWATVSSGITNSAILNELMKSDGTNAIPSGLYSGTLGDLILGIPSTTTGTTRTITTGGSITNINLNITPSGSGQLNLHTSTGALSIYTNGGGIGIGGNNISTGIAGDITIAAIGINAGGTGVGNLNLFGSSSNVTGINGGDIKIISGTATTGNASGGIIYLFGGFKSGTGKEGNIAFFRDGSTFLASFGGGEQVMQIGPATSAPTSNPTDGFVLYVDPADNKLKARGISGTITTIALP